jgi:hypothetical protein
LVGHCGFFITFSFRQTPRRRRAFTQRHTLKFRLSHYYTQQVRICKDVFFKQTGKQPVIGYCSATTPFLPGPVNSNRLKPRKTGNVRFAHFSAHCVRFAVLFYIAAEAA